MSSKLPPAIADFRDSIEIANPWVDGPPPAEDLRVVPYRTQWVDSFAESAAQLRAALGDRVIALEHVGSTAVPGLAAKDVIDIDLIIADPSDEQAYLSDLLGIGYKHTVREPEFEEHRMLRGNDPRVNLHVYGPNSAEATRHLLFRDWLRNTPSDAQLYADAKQQAASLGVQEVMQYNARKAVVVREIYSRIFSAHKISLADRANASAVLPELPVEVAGQTLSWRPVTPADFDLIFELRVETDRVDYPREAPSRESIDLSFKGDRFAIGSDSILAQTLDGQIVAYGLVALNDRAVTQERVHLDGVVHPAWRRKGIGAALLAWQEARARQKLAEQLEPLPAMLAVGASVESAARLALFESVGFGPVRWWDQLWRSLEEAPTERTVPEGTRLIGYSSEYSEATRIAMNDAFRDHWGSQPKTAAEWNEYRALPEFSAELSRLVVTGSGAGDDPIRVLGAVLADVNESEWEKNGGPFAYISLVGVIREWRGRGLAPAMLTAALSAYRDAGMKNASLDVDSSNPSGAHGIYTRLGFAPQERFVTYAKYL
ncbi:GNAT family N-acetyltransferase [Leucobacter sp. UT-8R-CII-1-4]|uniref:GNAT family N-acetyltransferase n=1 Tax=Leucobacter sp. UT-8R-CII-1-4 TaxID=3040075 RepID=UPI0024A7E479|nr:GNAT family N-acetyltransferase [Leucobacter sp. UT-8R-CII-1-4]MDI6021965.1 GNAT family N-acetyltransferase [Leucobacter sp. UT-8R-CII-1-4]